jgi:transposase
MNYKFSKEKYREIMKLKGMTIKEAAIKAGVSETTIHRYWHRKENSYKVLLEKSRNRKLIVDKYGLYRNEAIEI